MSIHYHLYMAGLLILPMKRMLLVECSRMKTRKGLLRFRVSGKLMGMISMVVVAAASVPVSSTLSTAWWDTCGGNSGRQSVSSLFGATQKTGDVMS